MKRNAASTIADSEKVESVFRDNFDYPSVKLIHSMQGLVENR